MFAYECIIVYGGLLFHDVVNVLTVFEYVCVGEYVWLCMFV